MHAVSVNEFAKLVVCVWLFQ